MILVRGGSGGSGGSGSDEYDQVLITPGDVGTCSVCGPVPELP